MPLSVTITPPENTVGPVSVECVAVDAETGYALTYEFQVPRDAARFTTRTAKPSEKFLARVIAAAQAYVDAVDAS